MNKYFITPLRQRISTILVKQDELETWAKEWKFFFILSFGRSGTSFIADFLNNAEGTYVFHEPVFEDFYAHARAHYNLRTAKKYIDGFRKKEIYARMRLIPAGVYGETNSNLRCHADAIKRTFPKATMLHLIRDGRDVVRSHMSRRSMTIKNPFSMSMHPTENDPWRANWHDMDRFARICWYWQEENRRLRNAIGNTVQFEKVLSSYEYFENQVLVPCGIHIEKKVWEATVATPRNMTNEFSMPKWNQWKPEQKKTFQEVCGEEMAQCGYDI